MTFILQIDTDILESLLIQVSKKIIKFCTPFKQLEDIHYSFTFTDILAIHNNFVFRLPYAVPGYFKGILNADSAAPSLTE
jgi:hypothetical protein